MPAEISAQDLPVTRVPDSLYNGSSQRKSLSTSRYQFYDRLDTNGNSATITLSDTASTRTTFDMFKQGNIENLNKSYLEFDILYTGTNTNWGRAYIDAPPIRALRIKDGQSNLISEISNFVNYWNTVAVSNCSVKKCRENGNIGCGLNIAAAVLRGTCYFMNFANSLSTADLTASNTNGSCTVLTQAGVDNGTDESRIHYHCRQHHQGTALDAGTNEGALGLACKLDFSLLAETFAAIDLDMSSQGSWTIEIDWLPSADWGNEEDTNVANIGDIALATQPTLTCVHFQAAVQKDPVAIALAKANMEAGIRLAFPFIRSWSRNVANADSSTSHSLQSGQGYKIRRVYANFSNTTTTTSARNNNYDKGVRNAGINMTLDADQLFKPTYAMLTDSDKYNRQRHLFKDGIFGLCYSEYAINPVTIFDKTDARSLVDQQQYITHSQGKIIDGSIDVEITVDIGATPVNSTLHLTEVYERYMYINKIANQMSFTPV